MVYPYRKHKFPEYCAFPLYDYEQKSRCSDWSPVDVPNDGVCASTRRLPSKDSKVPVFVDLSRHWAQAKRAPPEGSLQAACEALPEPPLDSAATHRSTQAVSAMMRALFEQPPGILS